MLAPSEIDNMRFSKTIKGYNVDEVDDFLDQLTADYERLYKENAESSNYNIIVEVKNENGDIKYNIPKMYSKYMADMLGEKYAYSHILLQ